MSAVSRRGLFGLLAGAAATPLLSRLPAVKAATVSEDVYATTWSFQRYSGYEVLNITPSDILTAAEFDWNAATAPH